MIDQLTCYWSYNAPWDHLPKVLIESCCSLPVDNGTWLVITKEALLTNCSHETTFQIYASSMSLTHWCQYHQILPPRLWWQWLTCDSLSCLLAIWSMTSLVFMWKHWSVAYLLMNICKYLLSYMMATYLPVHLFPFKFSYPDVQFDKNAYPKMWKFWKNYDDNIIPCPIGSWFQNMSEQCQCL